MDKSTIIIGDFNTPLLPINTPIQKISKVIEKLNTINQQDLIDIIEHYSQQHKIHIKKCISSCPLNTVESKLGLQVADGPLPRVCLASPLCKCRTTLPMEKLLPGKPVSSLLSYRLLGDTLLCRMGSQLIYSSPPPTEKGIAANTRHSD